MDLVLTACYMSKTGSVLGSFIISSLPLHLDHDSGPGRAACLLRAALLKSWPVAYMDAKLGTGYLF